MNATTRNRDRPGAETDPGVLSLDETVARGPDHGHLEHAQPNPSSVRDDRPTGSPDMPTPYAPGQNRYTYGSGARPLDGYTVKRAIGRGGFGEVYYATSDSGKEVALKLIVRNLDVERRGVVQCMNLKCPNLLQVYDLRSNDAGDAFVIMEYVAGPSLANVLSRHPQGLPEAEARAWLKGLVEGVAYLHDHGIVHRDLKPANLFMEEGLVKIGDYGLAKLIAPGQGSEHSESIGTCHYMAPEISSGKYHKPIDVYAIGVILYEMLTGRVPFEGETVGEVLMKHLTARPDVSKLAEPFRSIVSKALAKDPNHRPSRVYDLLPPGDGPKAAAVRFIGDGKTAPTLPDPGPSPAPSPKQARAKEDDVFRIEAEEPVFYIGPDTRPPQRVLNDRLRAIWNRRATPNPSPRPSPNPAPRRVVQANYARPVAEPPQARRAPQAPVPPPVPPEPPTGRARVAELTGSMLWAAPVAALVSSPALLAVVDANVPERLAFLFVMTLLSVWAVLAKGALLDGRALDPAARRFVALTLGVLVGLGGGAFASFVDLGALPHGDPMLQVEHFDPNLIDLTGPAGRPSPALYAVYFGLMTWLSGLTGLAARDRKRRVRIWPVAKAVGVAALLALVVPFPQPWGAAVAAATAVTLQLVSPWSAPAAAYARYVAKAGKAARRARKLA